MDDVIRPLCIVLPQMNGYMEYFDNGGKNMSFVIEDDIVLIKYNEIWNKIKKTIGIKFHSKRFYDKKYVKAKVKTFNGAVKTILWGNKITKEGINYTCIAAINIDSVMKMDKKNYPQVYIEECRYEIKKKKMTRFIDGELELDDSDSEFDSN